MHNRDVAQRLFQSIQQSLGNMKPLLKVKLALLNLVTEATPNSFTTLTETKTG
jgi:hypothetical protein